MTDKPESARPPAHLSPYFDVLGEDLAVEFLLTFGGSYQYLSERPQARSPIAQMLGHDKAGALARRIGTGGLRIPLGKPFIARLFRAKDWTVNDIARHLHVSDVTVREWLKATPKAKRADDRQLKLI